MLIRYLRDEQGQKRGVAVAIDGGSGIQYGWSLCHSRDKFDRNVGLFKAICRAKGGANLNLVPDDMKPVVEKLQNNAKRYYKQYA